jgi:hypothetical protein
MSKNFVLIISFLVAVTSCDSSKKESLPTAKWKTIDTPHYTIQYPKEWKRETGEKFGSEFMLMSARTSPKDDFKENIGLLILEFSSDSGINLEKYAEISEEQVIESMENAKILSSKSSLNHGQNMHKTTFTASFDDRALTFTRHYWKKNNKIYVLTLTCEADQFDDYKDVGEGIMASFRLK